MTDRAIPANRRVVLGVVALVIGGLLISAASIGISVQLDAQARERGECLTEARNLELRGLRIEMTTTTGLLQWAIRNQGSNRSPAELAEAIRDYQTDVAEARQMYREAERRAGAC